MKDYRTWWRKGLGNYDCHLISELEFYSSIDEWMDRNTVDCCQEQLWAERNKLI